MSVSLTYIIIVTSSHPNFFSILLFCLDWKWNGKIYFAPSVIILVQPQFKTIIRICVLLACSLILLSLPMFRPKKNSKEWRTSQSSHLSPTICVARGLSSMSPTFSVVSCLPVTSRHHSCRSNDHFFFLRRKQKSALSWTRPTKVN